MRAASPDDRAAVIAYIAQQNNVTPKTLVADMPYEVLAAVSPNRGVIGAVLYINMREASIEMACAGEPGWFTKGNLREIFGYPFKELGLRRVTAIVHRKNKRSRDMCVRLGYKLEGVARHGFSNGDACIYGMLKRECRWIKENGNNETRT